MLEGDEFAHEAKPTQTKGIQLRLLDEVPCVYRPADIHEKQILFLVIHSYERRDPPTVLDVLSRR